MVCFGHGILGVVDMLLGCILYLEEGVNHGKRTDDKAWCVMVMGILELLMCCWSSIVCWRGYASWQENR